MYCRAIKYSYSRSYRTTSKSGLFCTLQKSFLLCQELDSTLYEFFARKILFKFFFDNYVNILRCTVLGPFIRCCSCCCFAALSAAAARTAAAALSAAAIVAANAAATAVGCLAAPFAAGCASCSTATAAGDPGQDSHNSL